MMHLAPATLLVVTMSIVSAETQSPSREQELIRAIRSANVERVELLLDLGVSGRAFVSDGRVSMHPLLEAVRAKSPEIVKLLLDRGAEPDFFVRQPGGSLTSPIDEALALDDMEILRLLRDAMQDR